MISKILAEFEKHGAATEIRGLIDAGFIAVETLSESEKLYATHIADAIAHSPLTKDKEASHHYPEAEAIALMGRNGISALELLLDERAARNEAQARHIAVIGFAGVLIRAYQRQILSAELVRIALRACQRQGTHYSNEFIAEVYHRLKEGVV